MPSYGASIVRTSLAESRQHLGIRTRGGTLPTASTVYDRLQVGITANGNTTDAHRVYVDDVVISTVPLRVAN